MHYLVISFTHKLASIEDREKLCFSNSEQKSEFLRRILSIAPVQEAILVSTCNRIEVYAVVKDFSSIHLILEEFSKKAQFEFLTLARKAQIFQDKDALIHIFSVASGLDSLVIGDAQIIAQVKNDFKLATQLASLPNLQKVMQQAFKAHAKIKNETSIFKHQLSISSIAVKKAKSELVGLKNKEVLVVGAGTMGKIACQYLIKEEAKITLLNRTLQKAKDLVNLLDCNIKVKNFADLKELINDFEVIFFATSCNEFLITQNDLKEVNFKRYFFDLALPRDIDITQNKQNRVYYIDDLQEIAKENEDSRKHSIMQAKEIIKTLVDEFLLTQSKMMPTIKLLRQRADKFINLEVKKAIKKGYLKNSSKDEACRLVEQVFNSFLHIPTVRLKELSTSVQTQALIEKVNYIFDLDKEID